MTLKEFEKRYNELKSKNSKIEVFDFNNQKPIDYLKIEVFEVVVDKDKCMHTFGGKPEWTKNFVLEIGKLCGVISKRIAGEKISKTSSVATYKASRLNPSGAHDENEAAYDFDAEARIDSEYWEERVKFPNSEKDWKHKTEAHRQCAISKLSILAGSKADTGAEKRAIVKVLEFPKPDYKMVGTHFFCFKCIPNIENENVRLQILSRDNPSNSVFGTNQIEHKESDIIEQEPEKTAIFQIAEKREALKKNAALYKLSGLVVETESHTEEFLGFLKDFNSISLKANALLGWVKKFEPVDPIVEAGSNEIITNYLKDWGKN